MKAEVDNFTRRQKAICKLMQFAYGSLWVVGENIWKEKLASRGYDANSNRLVHPGICLQGATGSDCLHSVVPMLHGTSNRTYPAYKVTNFFNKLGEEKHISYFGYKFGAVPIEIERIGAGRVIATDFSEEEHDDFKIGKKIQQMMEAKRNAQLKDIVRQNSNRPQLNCDEVAELRRFARRFLSIG